MDHLQRFLTLLHGLLHDVRLDSFLLQFSSFQLLLLEERLLLIGLAYLYRSKILIQLLVPLQSEFLGINELTHVLISAQLSDVKFLMHLHGLVLRFQYLHLLLMLDLNRLILHLLYLQVLFWLSSC